MCLKWQIFKWSFVWMVSLSWREEAGGSNLLLAHCCSIFSLWRINGVCTRVLFYCWMIDSWRRQIRLRGPVGVCVGNLKCVPDIDISVINQLLTDNWVWTGSWHTHTCTLTHTLIQSECVRECVRLLILSGLLFKLQLILYNFSLTCLSVTLRWWQLLT